MPDRILGLDIGHDSVKAVQVTRGLKGFRVTNAAVITVTNEESGLSGALSAIFDNPSFRGSACVTSLPLKYCSFRTLLLPFRERKKIRQTIAFEMEQHIPYPIDDVIVDFMMVEQGPQSKVLAAAVPKEAVSGCIRRLEEHHVEAHVIDVDSLPVAAALLAGGIAGGCGLFFDIGAEDTAVVLYNRGAIVQARHFAFGGAAVTAAIAHAGGIDAMQAEALKRSGDAGETVAGVRAACLPFLREVQNMLKFIELRGELDTKPEAIILTGGGALAAPLREEMEKFFSLPVRLADLSGLGDLTFDDEAKASWDPALMNQALALATGEMRKEPGFNFGRGEFEPRGKVEKWKKEVMLIAASVAVILFLAGVDFFLGYYYDRAHLKEVKGRINAVFAEVAPEVTKIVDPVGQLRAIIDESKKTGSGGSLLASGMTMLDILKDISRLVPAEVDFVISSFTFDGGFIEIRGETDNFNTVDAIKMNLEKSPFFRSATISSANLMKGESRVGFDLKIEIKRK